MNTERGRTAAAANKRSFMPYTHRWCRRWVELSCSLLLLVATASSYAVADDICLLKGRWQSNKEMTVASMNKTGTVTNKQRALFNGDFFGKLTIDATCDTFTSHFDGNTEETTYETLSQSADTITFRDLDPIEKKLVDTTLTIVDGCYATPIKRLNFNEYFCKVEQ